MLELYQAEGCPHSEQVRETMTDLGLSFVAHNPRTHEGETRNETTRDALEAVGGEDQIPMLVDPNRRETLYESDEIVDYLREHYGRR